MIKRLTPDIIRTLHEYAIERYGGLPGEYEPGFIDYMADKPFSGFAGVDFYPGLFMKAAVYMKGFAANQYFCDGNKRTAYLCAAIFLLLNGYRIIATDDEIYEITLAVAKREIDLDELAEWLELKAYPIIV